MNVFPLTLGLLCEAHKQAVRGAWPHPGLSGNRATSIGREGRWGMRVGGQAPEAGPTQQDRARADVTAQPPLTNERASKGVGPKVPDLGSQLTRAGTSCGHSLYGIKREAPGKGTAERCKVLQMEQRYYDCYFQRRGTEKDGGRGLWPGLTQ